MKKSIVLIPLTIVCALATGCTPKSASDSDAMAEAASAIDADACPAGVPAAINPAPDQTLKSTYTGTGVQIYTCIPAGAGYAWSFIAPQANLTTDEGDLIGTHFIGPTWQANNGSSVSAAKKAGATVDPTAIPWLLLTATSHSAVDGKFSDVTSIQRLSTVGGLAPATGCDAAHVGAIKQVPYQAQYFFYTTSDGGKVKQCTSAP